MSPGDVRDRSTVRCRVLFRCWISAVTIGLAVITLQVANDRLCAKAAPVRFVRISDPGQMTSEILDEDTARLLFPMLALAHKKKPRHVYDPTAVVLLSPNYEFEHPWDEHTTGKIVSRTNNFGFRKDTDIDPLKRDGVYRILVVGDSHTEGVVHNHESFANVLERLLNGSGQDLEFEVLNAGVGGTEPHLYLGVLSRYASLDLDMVIAAPFMGNDVYESVLMDSFFRKKSVMKLGDWDGKLVENVSKNHAPVMAQGLYQAFRFTRLKSAGESDQGISAMVECFSRMAKIGEDFGFQVVVAVIPTKSEVDRDDLARVKKVAGLLTLSEDEALLSKTLRRKLIAALESESIFWVDPTRAMVRASAPCYWTTDYHLNVQGHRILAREIARAIGPLLARRK